MTDKLDEQHHQTVLVTGGCGYLGSQLIRDLVRDPPLGKVKVRILDNFQSGHRQALFDLPQDATYEFIEGDILDASTLRLALSEVDAVVHLAAIARTPMSFENPSWLEQVNHWGTARLVDSCLEAGVTRFILASSAAVYGPGGPFSEESPCRPVSPYGQSKFRAEKTVLSAQKRGLRPMVLRLGILFGSAPVTRFDAVVNRLVYLAGVRRSLTVYGNGQQRRPFLHVRDASEAIRFLLAQSSFQSDPIFNAAGVNASVLDIVGAIRSTRQSAQVRYTEQDILTHLTVEMDSSKLMALGWKPSLPIKDGVTELLSKFESLTEFMFSVDDE